MLIDGILLLIDFSRTLNFITIKRIQTIKNDIRCNYFHQVHEIGIIIKWWNIMEIVTFDP